MTVTNTGLPSVHRGDCAEARPVLLAHPTMARSGASEHHHVAATDCPLRSALVHRHDHPRPGRSTALERLTHGTTTVVVVTTLWALEDSNLRPQPCEEHPDDSSTS